MRRFESASRRRLSRGFTLQETLVALAVFSIVLGLATHLVIDSSRRFLGPERNCRPGWLTIEADRCLSRLKEDLELGAILSPFPCVISVRPLVIGPLSNPIGATPELDLAGLLPELLPMGSRPSGLLRVAIPALPELAREAGAPTTRSRLLRLAIYRFREGALERTELALAGGGDRFTPPIVLSRAVAEATLVPDGDAILIDIRSHPVVPAEDVHLMARVPLPPATPALASE